MRHANNSNCFSVADSSWVWSLGVVFSFASLLLLLSSCEHNTRSEALTKRITEYYILEQQNEWQLAYQLRPPLFRQVVGKNNYVSTMLKDNQGWKLKEATPLSSVRKGKKVYVKMRFKELVPPEYSQRLGLRRVLREAEFVETGVWQELDGKWYCLEPGERSHLPLNAEIVSDQNGGKPS
jgi:hypothetical protein